MPYLSSAHPLGEGSPTRDFFQVSTARMCDPGSPVAHLWHDTANLIYHSKLLASVLSPFGTRYRNDELYLHSTSTLYLLYFAVMSFLQTPILLAAMFVTLILSLVTETAIRLFSFFVWRLAQGPPFQVCPARLPAPSAYNSRHRWVYINGVATTAATMAQELEFLSTSFSTPVLGINNRTYGFLGDILECLIQRAFGYHTKETRIAKQVIKSYLLESKTTAQSADESGASTSIEKVILIAHSQGGILAAHILDSLLLDSDLSPSDLAKLEIYTFGSAAVSMNNPYADQSHTRRLVPVMEHYCNEFDMVASWGAMSGSRDDKMQSFKKQITHTMSNFLGLSSRQTASSASSTSSFKGKVFIRAGETGHLLDQHYLRPMFGDDQEPDHTSSPAPHQYATRARTRYQANKDSQNKSKNKNKTDAEIPYLDRAVQRTDLAGSLAGTEPQILDSDARYVVLPRRPNCHLDHDQLLDSLGDEKSVREVSGLWRYLKQ